MRICFICDEYPPVRHGGIGVFTSVMARTFARAGHAVRVVGITSHDSPYPEYEDDCGVCVWRLRYRSHKLAWMAARRAVFSQVSRWAAKGEIDLVEAPDYEGPVAGWPPLAVPVLVRMHGSLGYFAAEMGWRRFGGSYLLERAALRRADFLCSTSRYTAERTASIYRLKNRPVDVLYNAVEVPQQAAEAPRDPFVAVYTGTLTAKKGIDRLIEAWPHVKAAEPRAELQVFGKDGQNSSGRSVQTTLLARLNGLSSSVYFHGHVPREQIFGALDRAAVAVFPSRAEAFALGPMEAMAHGCPTIYSRRGSGPELIRDGCDGLLVEPENPLDIAGAICRVLRDSSLAARLGSAGRERVRAEFTCELACERNLNFYRKCIEEFRER